MKSPFRLLAGVAALLLLFCGSLRSAEQSPIKPRQFRLISMVGTYENIYYQAQAGKPPVSLRLTRAPSAPLQVPAGSTLQFFREIPPPPDAPPGTPPIRQILLKTAVPQSEDDFIVVARPLVPEDKQTSFDATVLPFPKEYVAGTCLVANLSPFPEAAISLKNEVHHIKQGERKFLPLENGHNLIKIAVQVSKSGRWELAGDDAWRLWPGQRGLILVFPYIRDPDFPPPINPPPAGVHVSFEHLRSATPPQS